MVAQNDRDDSVTLEYVRNRALVGILIFVLMLGVAMLTPRDPLFTLACIALFISLFSKALGRPTIRGSLLIAISWGFGLWLMYLGTTPNDQHGAWALLGLFLVALPAMGLLLWARAKA